MSALTPVRPVRFSTGKGVVRALAPAAVLGALVLVLWQGVVSLGGIQAYLLPAPTTIAAALASDATPLLAAAVPTTTAIVSAVVLGGILGVLGAIVITLFEGVAKVVLSLVAIASCAPIVALAPIFNAWFGSTSLTSKIAVATVAVAFPVVVNTTRGLLRVDPLHRELLDSLSATRGQLLWLVRLPGALPSLFDGLRIGSTMSVIAVIVAEYFGGTAQALGVVIANSAAVSRFDLTWAAVALASAIGLALYALVALVEALVVPWRRALAS